MNKSFKNITLYVVGTLCTLAVIVVAGTLSPTVSTDTTSMVTLQDLWNKTQDFTYSTSSSPRYISTSSSPLASFKSLQDVWDSLTENPITSNIILTGNTVLGVEGSASAGITWLTTEATTMNWAAASSTCVAKGNGARLPTIGELLKALAGQFYEDPPTNSDFTDSEYYWSGTEYTQMDQTDSAWDGGLGGGTVRNYYAFKHAEYLVRCVR